MSWKNVELEGKWVKSGSSFLSQKSQQFWCIAQSCWLRMQTKSEILTPEHWTSFFEHWKNSNVFIYWWSNSNTLFLASNKHRKLNLIGLPLDLLNYSWNWLEHNFFRTSNELERVHLFVIALEHHIFGFERSNIKLQT